MALRDDTLVGVVFFVVTSSMNKTQVDFAKQEAEDIYVVEHKFISRMDVFCVFHHKNAQFSTFQTYGPSSSKFPISS